MRWEDGQEREWRAEYERWRQGGSVDWDDRGEKETRERYRQDTRLRRDKEVSWDDGDERACMEMYRKKYGK